MTPKQVEEPAPPGTPELKRPPTPALDEAGSADFSILTETETEPVPATGAGRELEGAGPTGAVEVDDDVVIVAARTRPPPQDQHGSVERTAVHARPVVKRLLDELACFVDKVALWPTCAENEVKVICYRPVSRPFNLGVNVDSTTVKDGDVDEEVVCVVDFKRNEDGRPGPIEIHGRVKPDMWMSSINGASTLGLGYNQTLRMLQPDMTKGCFCLGFAPLLPTVATAEGGAVELMDVCEGGEDDDGAGTRVRLKGRAWGGAWEEREEMHRKWVPCARALTAAMFPGWGRGDETFVSTLVVMTTNTDSGRTWTWPGVKVNCQCNVKGVKMIPHMLCYGGHHTKPQSRYETRPIILGELWQLLAKRRGDPGIEEYQLQMDYKAALSFAIAVCLFEINAKQRALTLEKALRPYQRWFIVNPFVHGACGKIMCSCEDGGAKAAQSKANDRHHACKVRRFECREASCGLVLRVYDWAKRTGAIPPNIYDEDVGLYSKRPASAIGSGDGGSSTKTKQRCISPTSKATSPSAAAPSATLAAPQRPDVVLPRPLPTHPPTYSYYLNHHAVGNVHINVKSNARTQITSSVPSLLALSTVEPPPQLSPGHMDEFYRLSEVRRRQMREQLEREIWLERQHSVQQQQQQQPYVISPSHQLQHQQQYALQQQFGMQQQHQPLPDLHRASPPSTHQPLPQQPTAPQQAAPQQQQQQREADGQSKRQAPVRHVLLLEEASPQLPPATTERVSSAQLLQTPTQVLQQQQQPRQPFPQQLERPPTPPQPPSGQQQQVLLSSTQQPQQPDYHQEQPKAQVLLIPLPSQEQSQARAAFAPLPQRCSQSTQTDTPPLAVDAIAPSQITPVELLSKEDHEKVAQLYNTLARTLQALVDKDPAADDCTTFARMYLTTLMQMLKRGERKETVDAIVKVLGASIEDCTEAPRRSRKRKREMDKAQKELASLSSGSMPNAAESDVVQPQPSLETIASSSLGGEGSVADANVSVADTLHARLEAAREAVEHAKVCRESWERLVVWVERCYPAWKKELDAIREERKARKTHEVAEDKASS